MLREIHEEVGVPVRDITYLGSQAWPFPRSLMVGFQAVADADAPLRPAEGEIAEAMWVTRAELRQALAAGDWAGAEGSRLLLPGAVSIARAMLEAWARSADSRPLRPSSTCWRARTALAHRNRPLAPRMPGSYTVHELCMARRPVCEPAGCGQRGRHGLSTSPG